MLLESGQGAAGKRDAGPPANRAGQREVAARYDAFASQLFDFCAGVLADRDAAVAAARAALDSPAAPPGVLPGSAQLRLWLFTCAHQACAAALSRGRAGSRDGLQGSLFGAAAASEPARAAGPHCRSWPRCSPS